MCREGRSRSGVNPFPNATEQVARLVLRDNPSPREVGAVVLEVSADPEGRAYRCKPLQTIGNKVFGPAACRSHRRWRLAEPKDAEGLPSFAIFQTIATFHPSSLPASGVPALKFAAEITLGVSADRELAVQDFSIATAVSSAGRVTHCEGDERVEAALAGAACDIAQEGQWDILTDAQDRPVPYVRHMRVAILAQPLA